MDLPTFQALLSSAGQAALAAAVERSPTESTFLNDFTSLSRRFPAELARLALEIAILRHEAAVKFPYAEQMYFTRPALEQASSHTVAAYRAGRYAAAGLSQVLDLGCSVGGDTLALAEQLPSPSGGPAVTGLDRDPLRLAMARANTAALGLDQLAAFVQADLLQPLPVKLTNASGLFFDPARRTGERRVFSVQQYQPPLRVIDAWLAHTAALGVKISPGVELAELSGYTAEVEFISLNGELKEAALWFGPLRTARFRATLLPGPHTLADEATPTGEALERPPRLGKPQRYLYEPDPAVLRAGLVRLLGERLEAAQLDPDIAYLTGEQRIQTPFARCWEIETWMPFQLKRLRAALRQRGVGQVVVKKRGSPISPEQLVHDLKLKDGMEERVLFLTHLNGQPIVVIAYPYQS
jgi:hypothetical protein